MKHVRLRLTANGREAEIHPMYDLLANGACVERAKTIHWNFSGEDVGIMHYIEGDIEAFRDALDSLGKVSEFELTPVDENHFFAYLMCTTTEAARRLFGTLSRGRLVVVPPMEYAPDGTVSISLVGASAEIQAAIEGVPEPVRVDVEQISGIGTAGDAVEALLSERQREAVTSALDLGYYDVPREASVADVAGAMGCARSTAAEHLRKSEAKLLRSLLRN